MYSSGSDTSILLWSPERDNVEYDRWWDETPRNVTFNAVSDTLLRADRRDSAISFSANRGEDADDWTDSDSDERTYANDSRIRADPHADTATPAPSLWRAFMKSRSTSSGSSMTASSSDTRAQPTNTAEQAAPTVSAGAADSMFSRSAGAADRNLLAPSIRAIRASAPEVSGLSSGFFSPESPASNNAIPGENVSLLLEDLPRRHDSDGQFVGTSHTAFVTQNSDSTLR